MRRLEIDNWFTKLGVDAHLEIVPVATRTEWLNLNQPEHHRATGWAANPDWVTYCPVMLEPNLRYAATIAHEGTAAYLDYILITAVSPDEDLPADLHALAFHVQAHAIDVLNPRPPCNDGTPAAWLLDNHLDPSLLHLGIP